MKAPRFLLLVLLVSLSIVAFAQTHAEKAVDKPASSEAQKAFSVLKSLAGTWQAKVTTPDQPQTPREEGNGATTQVTLRVTSRGNAIVHEVHDPSVPDDPARYDHPLTMLYLDGERLTLTHYCDSGNRPRMVARTSPDGKTVEFDFVDVVGPLTYGHMHHAVFTTIDTNHHTEDWTWMFPGDKLVKFHFDLMRKNDTASAPGQ